jgi:hypothetical protein
VRSTVQESVVREKHSAGAHSVARMAVAAKARRVAVTCQIASQGVRGI